MNDLKFAFRQLLKHPGFTAVAVLTLALGIGANTALFSVVNGVLLNALPFPQPEQLVMLHQSKPNFDQGAIPYPNFRDWQKDNQTFSAMAIMRGFSFSLMGAGEPERVNARLVSGEFFSVLGVNPVLGRNFRPDEDQPGAGPVIIISDALWQRKFAAAPDVVGKGLTLDDKSYTIIGVLPADFALLRTSDVYGLIGQWNGPPLRSRSAGLGLHGVGRIKPGVTFAQAQADLDRVMQNLIALYPEANRGNGAKLVPLKEQLVGDVQLRLLLLLGAVGFVLLIACANVANLLLVRAATRQKEIALRTALGAGRLRILRQMITESVLLALLGGAIGTLLALWGVDLLVTLSAGSIPPTAQVRIDATVLFFTLLTSLLTGILFGLAPAVYAARRATADGLKDGGRLSTPPNVRRWTHALLVVQFAVTLALLNGAGLAARRFFNFYGVDRKVQTSDTLTTIIRLPAQTYATRDQRVAFHEQLKARLLSVPGVTASTVASAAPFSPAVGRRQLTSIDGRPTTEPPPDVMTVLVESGYFQGVVRGLVLGVSLLILSGTLGIKPSLLTVAAGHMIVCLPFAL